MFGLFKKKLKDVVDKFSKKTEEEVPKESEEESKEKKVEEIKSKEIGEEPKQKKFLGLFKKKEKKAKEEKRGEVEEKKLEDISESAIEEIKKEKPNIEEVKEEEKSKEKKTILEKIKDVGKIRISEEKFEKLFEDLELILLENNVAYEVTDKVKESLRMDLVNVPISNVRKTIEKSLRETLKEVLNFEKIDLLKKVKEKKPYVILFLGVNGAGKTTTMAKLCNLLLKNNLKCILVAADTFRAASIQQLEEHAKKLGVNLIKHDYGADPAAVAYDGVKHAEAKNIDVVLIDTAGRQHSNTNLMDELKKVNRVAKPDFKIFVGESITGNDIIEQVKQFNEAVEIDGIILSKLDVDDKGGAAISVSYVTGKPILYFGNGQEYNNLEEFDKEKIINNLGI
jgi:fused signal recognition particle receptor